MIVSVPELVRRCFNCPPKTLFRQFGAGVVIAPVQARLPRFGRSEQQGGNLMEWATLPFKKYADFTGRSRRKEYWMYVLLIIVVAVVIGIIEGVLGLSRMIGPYGPISALFLLATLCPSLAVGVRRLHDTNRPGWWLLIGYAPLLLSLCMTYLGSLSLAMIFSVIALIGFIVLLVLMVMEGTKGPNQYGPDPKGAEGAAASAA
jgi:uncharacterized membrane protein YhaH (DUF805 family)